MKNEEFFQIGLPKWPAFVVEGENVTELQAAEILIRTDLSFPHGYLSTNHKEYEREFCRVFNIPFKPHMRDDKNFDYNDYYERLNEFARKIKSLDLEYLTNHRIASCYINGPYGWCNWDGTIGSNSNNIGKWPDIQIVYEEWKTIAKAFPFLDLRCQLFNNEYCQDKEKIKPVVEFRVKNGRVRMKIPTKAMVINQDFDFSVISNVDREIGISIKDLKKKFKEVYGELITL